MERYSAFLADNQLVFENSFSFTKRQLSSDSLIFRINTDCNDNGTFDLAETFIQDFNGDNDFEDVLFEYSDNNNNGTYDSGDDVMIIMVMGFILLFLNF